MRKLHWLLLCLLLLVSSLSFSVEADAYPPMGNTEITERFLEIYDELEQAYQAYMSLYNGLASLGPRLQEISQTLLTGAEAIAAIQSDMQRIENAQLNYEQAVKKQIRDITIQAYLIGGVALLASILIVLVF